MSEQEATKSNENLRKLNTAVREFAKEYLAHPERFNDADLTVFKQALKSLHDELFGCKS